MNEFAEKEFLFKDEESIRNKNNQSDQWAVYLGNGLKEAEKLFPNPLTQPERLDILGRGWEAVVELAQDKSGFPDGDIETILKLWGKDGAQAKESLKNVPIRFAAIGYDVTGSDLTVDAATRQATEDEYTFYTLNEKQNRALEIASGLCVTFKELFDLGIYDPSRRQNLSKELSKLITIEFDPSTGNSLVPAARNIREIK